MSGRIEYLTVKKTDKPRNGPKTAASQTFTTEYEEKCAACCQTIADTFYELLTALYQLAKLDPAVKEKCSKNASRLWLLHHRICISGP
jgi:Fe-S-cluster containining protein